MINIVSLPMWRFPGVIVNVSVREHLALNNYINLCDNLIILTPITLLSWQNLFPNCRFVNILFPQFCIEISMQNFHAVEKWWKTCSNSSNCRLNHYFSPQLMHLHSKQRYYNLNIIILQLCNRSIPCSYSPTRHLWNNIQNPGNANLCAALAVGPQKLPYNFKWCEWKIFT